MLTKDEVMQSLPTDAHRRLLEATIYRYGWEAFTDSPEVNAAICTIEDITFFNDLATEYKSGEEEAEYTASFVTPLWADMSEEEREFFITNAALGEADFTLDAFVI